MSKRLEGVREGIRVRVGEVRVIGGSKGREEGTGQVGDGGWEFERRFGRVKGFGNEYKQCEKVNEREAKIRVGKGGSEEKHKRSSVRRKGQSKKA